MIDYDNIPIGIVIGGCLTIVAIGCLVVAFCIGASVGETRAKSAAASEVPRTIRLQLEVLGAGASAPTAAANESEAAND